MLPSMLDLAAVRAFYAGGATPLDLADEVARRLNAAVDPAIFITALDADGMRRQAEDLLRRAAQANSLPLWGVPFAVKDNIDVGGLPTTAGCPAFAFTPTSDAFVVARLKAAGAIVVGKTNLDQFATGLNGTRSPYGAPRCVFNSRYIAGGSSSGSAVAVASGLASFALGTDTAGSGRVPAAFNNIVGVKPTPGRLSTSGVVPACRSIDAVSVFAGCVADGLAVRRIAEGLDAADPFSREVELAAQAQPTRIGVLRDEDRVFYGDAASATLYEATAARLSTLGCIAVPFDFAPFRDAARLLYDGPWVAERLAATRTFLAAHRDDVEPTVRAIIESGARFSAVDAFEGRYALEALRRRTQATWAACDALLLPTAPTIYTVEAMLADPVALNSHLGHYTNFANLLGLAAIAVPAGFGSGGLPFGVTLVGPAGADEAIAPLADALHRAADCGMGASRAGVPKGVDATDTTPDLIELAVVGAHLSGMPLNSELLALGAVFRRHVRTTADYRLFELAGTVWLKPGPPKPGLIRDPGFEGPGIDTEIWALPPASFARFVSTIPAPLGIGKISMRDGSTPSGFLCERWATETSREITSHGGWRAFVDRESDDP